ncbi:hypothetical protein NPIL_363071 [Nephila pilipes]|uniref:Uncharacterized protein n=1 Tax=Nephila pilipes TaxID=299642 RepID=A0A8X6P4A2_NEPPI|nr:hypothetical protein NPIL_363071 [Nephila pilipes]
MLWSTFCLKQRVRMPVPVSSFLQSEIHVGNITHPNYSVPPFFEWYGRTLPSRSSMPRYQMDKIITSDPAGSSNMHQGGPKCILC